MMMGDDRMNSNNVADDGIMRYACSSHATQTPRDAMDDWMIGYQLSYILRSSKPFYILTYA